MTTIHINNWIRFHSCSVSADQKSELGKIIRPPLMWEFLSSLPSRHSVRRIFWGQMTDNPLGHWNQWFFCVGGFLSDLKCEKNFGGLDNYQYQLRLKIPERCSASSTTKGSGRANPQRLPKLWKKKLLICQWTHYHQIPMEQTCIQVANICMYIHVQYM